MKKKSNRQGGANIERVEALHKLAVTALIQQLEQEIAEGSVKATTVTAALKVCDSSGVIAAMGEDDEMIRLNSLLDNLNFQEPVF